LRKFNTLVPATAIVVAFGTAASAAPFDGPFVGAQIGWQSEKINNLDSSFGALPFNRTKKSVTGGLFAGYDKTFQGRFVVGTEGGIDFASDDEEQISITGTSYAADPKYSIDLTARAGYLVTPKTLLYVRGGYTNARIRTTLTNAAGIEAASDSHDGWIVGGGVEQAISSNVSARIEYRYSKYTKDGGKDERNRVLAGLSYRF
jgi:outer membrane immunogenic protein